MCGELHSRVKAVFASLLSDDWADDAIQHLQIDYRRQVEAGRPPFICMLDVCLKALGMVWREQSQRGLAYLYDAALVPAPRDNGDLRWYREYADWLRAAGISYPVLMTVGSLAAWSINCPYMLIIVVGTTFCATAVIFGTGKIAYRNGEFVLLAALFYFLPMAILLSAPASVISGVLLQNRLVGWMAFAAQLSTWMTIGFREFHGKWLLRPNGN